MMEETEAAPVDNNQPEAQNFDDLERQLQALDAKPAEKRTVEPPSQPDENQESQSESEPDSDSSETEDTPSLAAGEKLTVKALAEKLGTSPKALYDSIEIAGFSLGELKDRAQELGQSETLRAKYEADRIKTENGLMQKRREIQVAQNNLGREPTQQERQQAQKQWQDYKQVQSSLTAHLIPDWSDQIGREQGRAKIDSLLSDNLFTDTEIPALVDARLVKILNDHVRLLEAVNGVASLEVKPKRQHQPRSVTKQGSTVSNITQQARSGKISKEAAVDRLGQLLGIKP